MNYKVNNIDYTLALITMSGYLSHLSDLVSVTTLFEPYFSCL